MKNGSKLSELCRWVIIYILFGIGFFSFMVLSGESEDMTFSAFILSKLGAIAIIALCFLAVNQLDKRGLLPKKLYKEIEDTEI